MLFIVSLNTVIYSQDVEIHEISETFFRNDVSGDFTWHRFYSDVNYITLDSKQNTMTIHGNDTEIYNIIRLLDEVSSDSTYEVTWHCLDNYNNLIIVRVFTTLNFNQQNYFQIFKRNLTITYFTY